MGLAPTANTGHRERATFCDRAIVGGECSRHARGTGESGVERIRAIRRNTRGQGERHVPTVVGAGELTAIVVGSIGKYRLPATGEAGTALGERCSNGIQSTRGIQRAAPGAAIF
jgi:hypothetical protein